MQSGSRLRVGFCYLTFGRSRLQRARREARLGAPAMHDDEDRLPAFTDFQRLKRPLNDNCSASMDEIA